MTNTVSILKEIRKGERRVILTPVEVRKIVSAGYHVAAENNCGTGCGFTDADYKSAGADIVSQREAWECASLIVKYKAPLVEEYQFFSPNTAIAALFHAEGDRK